MLHCRASISIVFAIGGLVCGHAAVAQEMQPDLLSNDIQQGVDGRVDPMSVVKAPLSVVKGAAEQPEEEIKPKSSKPDLLVVPIPQSTPMLGFGVTLVGVLFYNPNNAPQPWVSGVGAMYTQNKSWAAGAFHSMSLGKDSFRLVAFAGYADVNVNFYGIGPNAGKRGIAVDLNEKGKLGVLQAQYRILPKVYLGGRYQFMGVESKVLVPDPIFPDLNLPDIDLKTRISALGPIATYDSRDNNTNPGRGAFATLVTLFNRESLGSDFNYTKMNLQANGYIPVTSSAVLGVRGSVCGVSTGGPFYDLCMYGISSDLRGYETGRYRDRAFWAMQAEWRQHLGGKFGAVFFGGIGGIAPDLGSLDDTTFLPSVGMGLRYRASKQTRVNLRLDFAMGKDSQALYFGIAEAF